MLNLWQCAGALQTPESRCRRRRCVSSWPSLDRQTPWCFRAAFVELSNLDGSNMRSHAARCLMPQWRITVLSAISIGILFRGCKPKYITSMDHPNLSPLMPSNSCPVQKTFKSGTPVPKYTEGWSIFKYSVYLHNLGFRNTCRKGAKRWLILDH